MQATAGRFILTPAAVIFTFVCIVIAILDPSLEMFLAILACILFATGFWVLSRFFQKLADSIPEQQHWEETK